MARGSSSGSRGFHSRAKGKSQQLAKAQSYVDVLAGMADNAMTRLSKGGSKRPISASDTKKKVAKRRRLANESSRVELLLPAVRQLP